MKSYSAMLWLTIAAKNDEAALEKMDSIENKLLTDNKEVIRVATVELEEMESLLDSITDVE